MTNKVIFILPLSLLTSVILSLFLEMVCAAQQTTASPPIKQQQTNVVILNPVRVSPDRSSIGPTPPNFPPICKGGLLSQHSNAAEILAYQAKYPTKRCRFMAPPRCGLHKLPQYVGQCTP